MKAAAYVYADGGPISEELLQLNYIDRFGVEAVMGRTLGYYEIRHMVLADNIVRFYNERKNSGKPWAEWAKANPDKNRLLNEALKHALDMGYRPNG